MHYGIDISSNNQHPLAWSAIYAYLTSLGGEQPFVIVKAIQGTGYTNPFAVSDIAEARAAGFAVGAYLMDQGNADPNAEEALFNSLVPGVPQFDDDELPEGLTEAQYIAHLQQLATVHPAIQYLNQSEVASGYDQSIGLWLAEYNGNPGVVTYPALIHQYNNVGTIPGAAGIFDLNVWLGPEAQFASTFSLAPPPPPIAEGSINMATSVPTGGQLAVRADGGVFAYGGARFYNSLPGLGVKVNNIVGIAPTKTGNGYWLVGSDGGVFAFGDAQYHGSSAANPSWIKPVVGIALDEAYANGYVIFADNGGPSPARYACNETTSYKVEDATELEVNVNKLA